MKFKKRVEVTVEERESRTLCDICGQDVDRDRGGISESNNVTIRAEEGDVFPECDCRSVEEVDCCISCWNDKVRPALQALGAKINKFDMQDGRLPTMPFDPEPKDGRR